MSDYSNVKYCNLQNGQRSSSRSIRVSSPASMINYKPHPFAGLRNTNELLPTVRGIISVADAIPVLGESASVCKSLLNCRRWEEDVLDIHRWKEDIWAIDDMDRNRGCRDEALRRFAEQLRDNGGKNTRGVRLAMSNFFGLPLGPDYNSTTIAYLKRIQAGMAHIDASINKACCLAFAIHAEAMIDALRGSMSATFRKPLRDIPAIELNLNLSWEVRRELFLCARPLNIGPHQHSENSFSSYYDLNLRWCKEIVSFLD